jgi:hypothetical protein
MQHGKSSGKSSLWAALGLAGLCACAEETGPGGPAGEPQAPECAGVDAPEPVTVETTVSVVATGPAARVGSFSRQLSPYFIADGSGLYWHDARGSVFAHHPGEAGAVELLQWAEPVEGELRESFILGIAASADQIYVTNGYVPTDVYELRGISDFRGPSRLLAVPKQGGPASLVLETEDSTLWPITVEGDRLIVVAQGTGGLSYHQVNLAEPEPRLERLPVKGSWYIEPYFAGDGLVWRVAERIVLTSGFDEAEPRRITLMAGEGFSVGPGYVMTERLHSEGTVAFIDTVDLQGKSRTCTQVPSSAPLIFLESFPAPLHVYYFNWVPGDDLADLAAHTELVQLELATGALTRLNLPGITVQNIRIVGQDAESLYVVNGDALLAIQKP